MAKLTSQQALERLMSWCANSEKSVYEAEKKLISWGLADKSENVISQLLKENFINPLRFAIAFTRDKMRFNKWGKIKIRYQLQGHRIDESTIRTALEKINDPEYAEMIAAEMQKKLNSLKISDPYQKKSKLYAFGNQRGYESELMNRFFEQAGLS